MKKTRLYLLISSLFIFTNAFSQYATSKGDMFFDVGIGLGRAHGLSYFDYSYTGYGAYNPYGGFGAGIYSNAKLRFPAVSIMVQKAFWDDITIGGFLAFDAYGYKENNRKVNELSFMTGARGEYHFNRLIDLNSNLDLYAGAMVGARIWNYSGEDFDNTGNQFNKYSKTGVDPLGGLFAGARYYFSDNLAVFGELGWAISITRIGLCWKL